MRPSFSALSLSLPPSLSSSKFVRLDASTVNARENVSLSIKGRRRRRRRKKKRERERDNISFCAFRSFLVAESAPHPLSPFSPGSSNRDTQFSRLHARVARKPNAVERNFRSRKKPRASKHPPLSVQKAAAPPVLPSRGGFARPRGEGERTGAILSRWESEIGSGHDKLDGERGAVNCVDGKMTSQIGAQCRRS